MGGKPSKKLGGVLDHDICKPTIISLPYNTGTDQISKLRSSQSPIAIAIRKCPKWTTLDRLKFQNYWYNKAQATLVNNGATAYFSFEDSSSKPRISGGPIVGEYIFEQMHFHWSVDEYTGCEHVLDGKGYAAECHLVHYNSKYRCVEEAVQHPDGLVVVGFMLELRDSPNPKLDKLVQGFEAIQKKDAKIQLSADSLSWMDRDDLYTGSYVTYKGSLTTPPFNECVTWIIYQKPVEVGCEQLSLLQNLQGSDCQRILRNVRPTQLHPPGHSVIYVEQPKSKL